MSLLALPGILQQQQTGTWQPSDITGLRLWLDASDETTITDSGGVVSQWNDKSGQGNHRDTVYNGGPTTGSRTHNSLNVLDFTPDDDISGSVIGDDPEGGLTVIAVAQMDDSTSGAVIAGGKTNDNDSNWALRAMSGAWGLFHREGDSGGLVLEEPSGTATSPSVVAAVWDVPSSGASVRVNGVTKDSVASYTSEGSPLDVNVTSVGALVRSSDALFMNGWVGEIIMWYHVASAGEIQEAEGYLGAKWGITIA